MGSKKQYKIIIIWGSDIPEYTGIQNSEKSYPEDVRCTLASRITEYSFPSEALLSAFLYGVNEASGYLEYDTIEPGYDDYKWALDFKERHQ